MYINHNASGLAANNNVKGHDDFDEGFDPDYSMGSDDNEMSWVCSEPMVHKEWFWLRMSHDNVHVQDSKELKVSEGTHGYKETNVCKESKACKEYKVGKEYKVDKA